MNRATLLGAFIAFANTVSCSSTYFNALESVGFSKRDLFVTRVKAARDAQEGAKESFQSALEKFQAVVRVDSSTLQLRYKELSSELTRCEDSATRVRNKIDAVESVSNALFSEWEDELDNYTNATLRHSSERSLKETRGRYQTLIQAMREAESRLEPALSPLRDNVLFLKHNLNAQAIASIANEVKTVESDVSQLVRAINEAIRQSDLLISNL